MDDNRNDNSPGVTLGNGTDGFIPGLTPSQPTFTQPEPLPDRASIRNANLQALQALKGELASVKPIDVDVAMQTDAISPKEAVDGVVAQILEPDIALENNLPSMDIAAVSSELASSPPGPGANESNGGERVSRGLKRKFDEMVTADEDPSMSDDAGVEEASLPLKVNPDGTVEQADTVRYVSPTVILKETNVD